MKNKPLYVIVHEDCIYRNLPEYGEVQRIKSEEDFVEIDESWLINPGLPKDREIFVCGAYRNLCVDIQYRILAESGYKVSVYEKATVR